MSLPVQYHYGKFPPKNIDWMRLVPLIGPANAALARYDGTLAAIPNASVLLSPLTTQEAVLSSRIEGTQATIGEVLEFEAEGETKDILQARKADINEVLNYREAMWSACAKSNTQHSVAWSSRPRQSPRRIPESAELDRAARLFMPSLNSSTSQRVGRFYSVS